MLNVIDGEVSYILDRALDGHLITVKEAEILFKVTGEELFALIHVADELRRRIVGDVVTYVINRNINFTNICINDCLFCAFSRPPNSPEGYVTPLETLKKKVLEAVKLGATEVCIQGGLHPDADLETYLDILRAVREVSSSIHIHAFSPMEVKHASVNSGMNVEEVLKAFKENGLNSMPGTAAEILVDRVRRVVCPRKIKVAEWVRIIKSAHRIGIPTSSTMMYGHIESERDKAIHIDLLRRIQRSTGGFTEFVPLSFVHEKTNLYKTGLSRPGATGLEDIKVHAVSRLMLGDLIKNIQVSWVKLGVKFAQFCLNVGANDFGGTLMEENISRIAGSTSGEYLPPSEIERIIRDCGRIPAQRTTTYEIIKINA
ncbi:MAG: 5-amino-6-(D-ribitylamino)uracil--L-tyrosine 4-hydroxyphenyl transferase CofH [Candidatus Freyarchaeota archaeon]|nr:5-amino-6-(D-ribitylamino)uracil--L-tyrosine 4-hydroxyphenyl transferase CofH [Candidatus Jordarchaeia archaeon]